MSPACRPATGGPHGDLDRRRRHRAPARGRGRARGRTGQPAGAVRARGGGSRVDERPGRRPGRPGGGRGDPERSRRGIDRDGRRERRGGRDGNDRCRDGDRRGRGLRRGCRRGRRLPGRHGRRRRDRRGSGRGPGSGDRVGRGRAGAGGQERERVEIPLLLRGPAEAEMDVGLRDLDLAARPDRADPCPFGDRGALGRADRAEVRQRHRVTVGRLDRDALPRGRDRPGEGDRPRGGRDDRRAGVASHVDASMLAGRVRMRRIEDERLEHGTARGPRPGACRRGEHERSQYRRKECSAHRHHLNCSLVVRRENARTTVETAARCCQTRLQICYRDPR